MKKIYCKPTVKAKKIKPVMMICTSTLIGEGTGTAEEAQGDGWKLNSKDGFTDLDLGLDETSSIIDFVNE